MARFFTLFTVIGLCALAALTLPVVREFIVDPFNLAVTNVAGLVVRALGTDVSISNDVLAIRGFAVRVMEPCNALEATLVLWAAVLAFPSAWMYKAKGLLFGALAIHSLNTLRVVSLLYLGAYDRTWFDWAHSYLWELLIMSDVLVVFLAWIWLMPSPSPDYS